LKARFPAGWAVGVLNHHAGMYPTWVHVEDLRRGGIGREPVTFQAPCVERSAWDTALEVVATVDRGSPPVRVGLHRVTGLTETTGARIVATRPYASLADFADRVRPTPPELDALIMAGALDSLAAEGARPRTRASMRLEARVLESLAHALPSRASLATHPRAAGLVLDDGAPLAPTASAPRPGGDAIPDLPELPLADLVRGEFAASGLWFSGHPLDAFVPPAALEGCVRAAQLERTWASACASAASRVRQGVWRRSRVASCCSPRWPTTPASSSACCSPTPTAAGAWPCAARWCGPEGRVDETLGALTVVVDRAETLGGSSRAAGSPGWQDAGPPSRNRVA
jgi:DNA polymerase III alpha subunit